MIMIMMIMKKYKDEITEKIILWSPEQGWASRQKRSLVGSVPGPRVKTL